MSDQSAQPSSLNPQPVPLAAYPPQPTNLYQQTPAQYQANPYAMQQNQPYGQGVPPQQYAQAQMTDPRYMTREQKEKMKLMEINRMIPRRSGGSWSGLSFRPEKVSFENQNPDEYVFVVVRSHWTSNAGWILRNFVYLFVPLLLLYLYNLFNLDVSFVNLKTSAIFVLVFYSTILTNIVRDFFDWYFDPYIVTNQRIVHYEFKPFSSYTIKETDLSHIEFVKEKAAGPLAGIFNYGNIIVATASERSVFEFKKIPEATLVRDIITDLKRIDSKYN